jgi:DnaJ-class molecular chaperone
LRTTPRLAGKGLPALGGGLRGDRYLRIAVGVPAQLSQRERRLYEELRATSPRC